MTEVSTGESSRLSFGPLSQPGNFATETFGVTYSSYGCAGDYRKTTL